MDAGELFCSTTNAFRHIVTCNNTVFTKLRSRIFEALQEGGQILKIEEASFKECLLTLQNGVELPSKINEEAFIHDFYEVEEVFQLFKQPFRICKLHLLIYLSIKCTMK